MPLQRYKLTIAYRGTHYHGWQIQERTKYYRGPIEPDGKSIPTIQGKLTRAIGHVVHHPVVVAGSSRTDAGVHAKGQVAHFDTELQIPCDGFRRAINAALPDDIVVKAIEPVPDHFDAAFSTLSKRYQYAIWNHNDRPAFYSDLVWHRWKPIDVPAMKDAAARLVGEHDFASFARPGHGREHTVRTVLGCDVSRRGPLIVVGVEATGFLWNMVRIIVGTLIEVGHGLRQPSDMERVLAARDRRAAGLTAPPTGLYLQRIQTSE